MVSSNNALLRISLPRALGGPLLVAALAFGLRVFNLLSLPIFLDEATYLNWAAEIWEQRTRMALFIPMTDDGKQPLFMWLAGGAGFLSSDPLMAGRMVSVLCGVLSAVGTYMAGRWLAGERAGLVAGLLYAVVPFNLFYDRLALVEALLNLAGVWTFSLSVYIAGRADGRREAVLAGLGLGLALGVGIWTKMPALLMLGFPVLCALLLSRKGHLSMSVYGFTAGALLFVLLAGLLALSPNADSILDKSGTFSERPESLLSFPWDRWAGNLGRYLDWLVAYMPFPLWALVMTSAVWGLVRRTRITLLLLGCWASFTLPTVLLAITRIYESRYVFQGVFLLLLMLAIMFANIYDYWDRRGATSGWVPARRHLARLAAGLVFLAILAPSLAFDRQLLLDPSSAPLPATDYNHFITGWPSGYGFPEAVALVKERVAELTRDGKPVIVLGYYWRGHTHAGVKLYTRGTPNLFPYVDMHLVQDQTGFMAAWKSHHVPVLVVGNEGLEDLDGFERAVPQARRIGYFPKPGGHSSFRVYEVPAEAFNP